jgi:hypothetical protein
MAILSYYGVERVSGMRLDIRRAIQFGLSSNLIWLMAGDPCPYCHEQLLSQHACAGDTNIHHLGLCVSCGWWILEDKWKANTNGTYRSDGLIAKLAEFQEADHLVPMNALRAYVAGQRTKFDKISPRAFERLAADVLAEHFKCEVRLSGHSKDGGIDMYAVIGERTWAFQVKRRLSARPEGIEGVREFLGALGGELRA